MLIKLPNFFHFNIKIYFRQRASVCTRGNFILKKSRDLINKSSTKTNLSDLRRRWIRNVNFQKIARISYQHSDNPGTRRFLEIFSAPATWCHARTTWCHAPATWFHACMQLHACNLDLATRACGRACMQSRSRKMHVAEHACNFLSTWVRMHARAIRPRG